MSVRFKKSGCGTIGSVAPRELWSFRWRNRAFRGRSYAHSSGVDNSADDGIIVVPSPFGGLVACVPGGMHGAGRGREIQFYWSGGRGLVCLREWRSEYVLHAVALDGHLEVNFVHFEKWHHFTVP